MSAAMETLTIEQGATFQISLNFNKPCDVNGNPGDPIDVSDWVFVGQMRSTYSSPVDTQDFTFSEGLTTNQILISLTNTQTAALPVYPAPNYQIIPSYYAYDIFATRPDTTVLKILQGPVSIIPRVTQ